MLDEFRSTYITWDNAADRIYSPATANTSDENGRKLVVQILNDGQVEDLTGAALHLYWETRDKVHDGLDVFKAVDLKKGEFELSYTTGMLSNHGVLNANLVLIDTIGRVVSERFKITVTEGIDDDAIQSSDSFTALTEALIDVSNLEQNYTPRLNDLTSQLQQTEMFSGQADFVDMVKNRTKYKELIVKKITSPYTALSIFAHNGKEHVTHEWRKNTNDDYWIYHVAFLGSVGTFPQNRQSTTSKTGAWSGPDGSGNIFTTEVGAKAFGSVAGEQITINHMADNRGGLFKVVIDGDEDNPYYFSTFNTTTIVKSPVIASGLSNKSHTIEVTFIGQDPDNPVATPRGWLRDDQTNHISDERYTFIGGTVYNGTYNKNTMLTAYASNKDWAFNITKNGQTHWFPEHNSQGTAFKVSEPKLIVDGIEIDFNDLEAEKNIKAVNVQFLQEVQCRFPGITEAIVENEILFSVGIDGVVAISGKLKMLQDALINNGYTFMLPLEQSKVNDFVTSIGSKVANKGDGSNQNLTTEKDGAVSFAGVDSRNPDLITAMSIDYPYKTLRKGKPGRGNPFYFINHRAQYPKLYPLVFFNHNAVAGETYNYNGRFAIARIPNVYNYIN